MIRHGIAVLVTMLASTLANADISKIMLMGEDAPGPGGQFQFPGSAFPTDDRDLFFLSSTTTGGCIFQFDRDGSAGQALFCEGGTPPVPGGVTWVSFSNLGASRSGDIAFTGRYVDGGAVGHTDLFYQPAGGAASQVTTFPSSTAPRVALNDQGGLIYTRSGVIRVVANPPTGPITVLVGNGQLPDDPTRFFGAKDEPALGPGGEVTFGSETTGVSPPELFVVYLLDGGVFTRLATEGTALAPGISGSMTYMGFFAFDRVGNLFAVATLSGGDASGRLVRWTGSEWVNEVSLATGENVTSLLGAAEDGDLLYQTTLAGDFLLYERRNGVTTLVAQTGDLAPGADGSTFVSFPLAIGSPNGSLSATGWAVSSVLDASGRGVFASTPPPLPNTAPALSPIALTALAAAVGLTALTSLGRRVARRS